MPRYSGYRSCGSLLIVLIAVTAGSVSGQSVARDSVQETPDSLVGRIYREVTFSPGTRPDWGRVRAMFHPDAVIVLRATRDSMAVMSVEGFVKDFVDFIDRAHADSTGFGEKVLRMKPMVFGDIATVLVLYEAHIPGSPRPPQQGVDSFHLVRKEGRWWIVSIVNEIITRTRAIPTELQN